MARPFFARPEVSDAAILTPSSETGTFLAANLLTEQPFEVWRSTGLVENLVLDLGSANRARCIWLGYTNATTAATWRIRAAATEAALTAAPLFDSGSIAFWPDVSIASGDWSRIHGLHYIDDAVTESHRWWRIDLSDAGNPAGFLEAGRLYVADGWRPSRGARFGWAPRYLDGSKHERNVSGNLFVTRHRPGRQFDLSISALTEAEAFDDVAALKRARGKSRDIVYFHDPTNRPRLMDWSIYGVLRQLNPISNMMLSLYESRFRIEEWEMP